MKPRPAPKSRSRTTPEFFSAEVAKARRFYLNLNPAQGQPLAVVCGGMECCTPDYAIHRQTFPFYSVEYVARGRGTLKLEERSHLLLPGRLFAYGPGVRHDITVDPADPLVKYFVDFSGRHGLKLLQAARLECLLLKTAEARAPLEGRATRAFGTYQQCRQHVQQHFLRLKTLGQLARECHADGAYLCRLFRRYDHQSPYQYLLRLKLNAAAEHLQNPDALVKQVAEQIGFNDPFHFSRAFKGVFGLSPEAFRSLR